MTRKDSVRVFEMAPRPGAEFLREERRILEGMLSLLPAKDTHYEGEVQAGESRYAVQQTAEGATISHFRDDLATIYTLTQEGLGVCTFTADTAKEGYAPRCDTNPDIGQWRAAQRVVMSYSDAVAVGD